MFVMGDLLFHLYTISVQKEIDAERKRLKELQKLEKQQTVESSGFQTDSPSTATTSTGSDEDTPPDRDGYPSKPKSKTKLHLGPHSPTILTNILCLFLQDLQIGM